MRLPFTPTIRPAVAIVSAAAAAVLAVPAGASAATSYTMQPCATGTSAAALWAVGGPLSGRNVSGVECSAASGEPTPSPARGNRGVFLLPPRTGTVSTTGNPDVAWTLAIPSSLTVTSGTLSFRGGAAAGSWRSYLAADGATIAGCFPNAAAGVDACPYDTGDSYFSRASLATVPAGTRTIALGLRCSSVDGYGRTYAGCTASDSTMGNDAYAAVVGGSLTLEDASAPTGSATLTQATPSGETASWTRSSQAAVRLAGVTAADVGRGVCALRLDDAASSSTANPIRRWNVTPNTAAFRQCDGLQPDELVSLAGRFGEGEHTVSLIASDSAQGDNGNRTTLGTVAIRTDDTAPSIVYPGPDTAVDGNTRAVVAPVSVTDALSGVASSSTTTTANGSPVAVDADGTLVVPAGGSVTSVTTATDRAGNTRTASYTVYGRRLPTPPAETTPTTPTEPTTTPTSPSPTPTPTPIPTPTPASKPARCATAARSSITTARFARKIRRLTVTGCRYRVQALRAEVQIRRNGRTATRTYALPGRDASWTRTLRLRSGETPRKARLLLTSGKHSAWRPVR